MPKIICHMRHGHPFTIKCGVQIPGAPKELEVSAFEAECIRADCRVVKLDKMPPKAKKAKKAAEKPATTPPGVPSSESDTQPMRAPKSE